MAKLGEGSFADLNAGIMPTRIIVTLGPEGWEASVFDFDSKPPLGRHRVWGPETHSEKEDAMRAVEGAGREYCKDYKTVLAWVDSPFMMVSVPPPLDTPTNEK
ncbi:MAG: hypothetical protein JWO13_2741 [Acidobacteriales bacterium]|nr:hypothetical protein [Terriglobales bacterium]